MQQQEPSRFGFESTADEVAAGVDLAGRVAVVTGASSGLGAETARVFAARGATVVCAARDAAKAEAVAGRIRSDTGNPAVEVVGLELGSLPSIRACAREILARHAAIHLLVDNAGVMACPLARTESGFELQLGTNHLGHFLLTGLLAPALRRGAPARVVCVSSGGHRLGSVDFDDPHYHRRPYDKWQAYGQAKTANIWHALALDRRLGREGVRAFAIHPGMIVTELGRHLTDDDRKAMLARVAAAAKTQPDAGPPRWKQPAQGAATQVWAATAPELEGRGGLYLEDCHVAGPSPGPEARTGYAPWALDAEGAERLWGMSEEMVGERF
ncbi:MAG: SDR family NAD(P)-dependent oxidoreductase [Deltaproteobacteria bacterium]|nr:SDR family NAD(P)-dependent oxidoreductase [Deltaproteobacteria bacterium]